MGGVGSGAKPREYPPEIVALVCGLYLSGMTVAEVRAAAPKGYRVQTILERHLAERRRAIKRNQSADLNHMWKGDEAGYQAAHLRVSSTRGLARVHVCTDCGEPADDWSYNHADANERTGKNGCAYSPDPSHYDPRCRPCHRAFDSRHRAAEEVMPYV